MILSCVEYRFGKDLGIFNNKLDFAELINCHLANAWIHLQKQQKFLRHSFLSYSVQILRKISFWLWFTNLFCPLIAKYIRLRFFRTSSSAIGFTDSWTIFSNVSILLLHQPEEFDTTLFLSNSFLYRLFHSLIPNVLPFFFYIL